MERYKEIERSIIKKYRKEIWAKFVKAVKDYKLINENDKVMVCISGGKDSFLLAKCVQELQKHGGISFEAYYVCMNPGYNEANKTQGAMTCLSQQKNSPNNLIFLKQLYRWHLITSRVSAHTPENAYLKPQPLPDMIFQEYQIPMKLRPLMAHYTL